MFPGSFPIGIRRVIPVLSLSIFAMAGYSQDVATSSAQTAQYDPGSTPLIKAYSEEVVVDVVVTDKKGDPVTSLSRDHFRVLEDGKSQQFRFFKERGVVDSAQASQASNPPLPQHAYSNRTVMGDEDQSAPLVLLLDDLNTPVKDQMYMRKQILAFLKLIPPGTRVALFDLNLSMRVLAGFTTDTSAIAAAVMDTTSIKSSGMLYKDNYSENPVVAAIEELQQQNLGDALARMTDAQRDERRLELRVTYTLDAIDALSKYLAGLPGRKNVVWFSASFPLDLAPKTISTAPGSTGGTPASNSGHGNGPEISSEVVYADFSLQLRHTTSLLSTSRIAVYPVDVRGVQPENVEDVENGAVSRNTSSSQFAKARGNLQMNFIQNLNSEENSMKDMAKDTGGEAFLNGNDQSKALGKALQSASSYYEIAYVPAHARDGKYHMINVKVDSPGARAAYRQGYYGVDPGKLPQNGKVVGDPLKPELQLGWPPSTQIPFYVQIVPLVPQPDLSDRSKRNGDFGVKIDGAVVRYAIDWGIDIAGLQTTTTADGHHEGKISFGGVAYDSDGKLLNSLLNTTDLNLTGPRFAQISAKGLAFHQELDLPKANVVLRVALIDRISGRTGSLEIPLPVK
jgi:VWFA-related protein